jgi:hypothetical protein
VKIIRAAHIAAGAMAVAMSCHVCAQASSPASASGTVASPATVSNKTADRALRKRVLTALARAKGLRATGITVRAQRSNPAGRLGTRRGAARTGNASRSRRARRGFRAECPHPFDLLRSSIHQKISRRGCNRSCKVGQSDVRSSKAGARATWDLAFCLRRIG